MISMKAEAGRRSIGVEIDEKYYKMAIERISKECTTLKVVSPL